MNKTNRITLEDILLCDPISKRGRNALERIEDTNTPKTVSLEDFYEKIYVEPYFIKDNKRKKLGNETTENKKTANIFDNFLISETGLNTKNLIDKKERYEQRFFSGKSDPLMFIRASAGSGKSIYLNKLKRERRKKFSPLNTNIEISFNNINDALELSYDLETSKSIINYGGVFFPSSKYKPNSATSTEVDSPWHFFNMIIDSLTALCLSIILEKNNSKKSRIKMNFNKVYGYDHEDEIEDLYGLLTDVTTDLNHMRNLREKVFEIIINICFVDPDNVSYCIIRALQTLTRLLTIQSNLEKPRQYLISFDNIEHFINNKKRIYDEDIKKISSAIINFCQDEVEYYKALDLKFAHFIKIILAVRDTTSKMLSADVHEIFNREDCSIDITGWFSLSNIYENKLIYFSRYNENSTAIKFFKLIMEEESIRTKNNLMEQICAMYNHNNRRTTRMLTRIAGGFEKMELEGEENKKSLNYEQYCKIWEWHRKTHIKYLCRQSVMRLIYNEIAATNFFENICANIEKCTTLQNTYAFRLLTWLANKDSHKSETYYSYYEIVKEIICNPAVENGNKLSYTDFLRFAEVLIALDEHRFEESSNIREHNSDTNPNCWCQLVIIKHNLNQNGGILDVGVLADKIKKDFEQKNPNSDICGIRLTEAGYFMAKIFRDFEYISCLYSKTNTPLIFMSDESEIKETIKNVYNVAEKHINNSLLFEYRHFNKQFKSAYSHLYHLRHTSKNGNTESQSVPYRIFQQHVAYLLAYQMYISDTELQNELGIFNATTRENLIQYIKTYINLYGDIIKKLYNNNYIIDKDFSGFNENLIIEDYVLKLVE